MRDLSVGGIGMDLCAKGGRQVQTYGAVAGVNGHVISDGMDRRMHGSVGAPNLVHSGTVVDDDSTIGGCRGDKSFNGV